MMNAPNGFLVLLSVFMFAIVCYFVRDLYVYLSVRFYKWQVKRYWRREQLYHLRAMINADNRWLAHDKVASILTERYLDALRDDWYQLQFDDSDRLRTKLGLDPVYPGSKG